MRIGILTGGGDCPGLNAVIRSVVRTATAHYDSDVIGFRDGWRGLLENRTTPLDVAAVDGLLTRGGTTLGSARVAPEKLHAGIAQMKGVLAEHEIDVLIPIGGEGTLTAAHLLSQAGVPVVGIPKTIDNDIDETDLTFG
ncbi:MAG: 6-phosphofructokinase, partial [Blastococcus sp.]